MLYYYVQGEKMPRKNYHVVKSGNHWAVKKQRSLSLSGHNTQQQAIESGKVIAKLTHGELVIHGRNGKIREKNTYAPVDRYPPKG